MNAEDAFLGYPSFALGGDEFSDAVLFDKFQVFNLAHDVFCPIAFVDVLEAVAGEFRTTAAVSSLTLGAGVKRAVYTSFRHVLFGVVAAVTGILIVSWYRTTVASPRILSHMPAFR